MPFRPLSCRIHTYSCRNRSKNIGTWNQYSGPENHRLWKCAFSIGSWCHKWIGISMNPAWKSREFDFTVNYSRYIAETVKSFCYEHEINASRSKIWCKLKMSTLHIRGSIAYMLFANQIKSSLLCSIFSKCKKSCILCTISPKVVRSCILCQSFGETISNSISGWLIANASESVVYIHLHRHRSRNSSVVLWN
jgi:hypothetical protein